jgi:hypothetical protein
VRPKGCAGEREAICVSFSERKNMPETKKPKGTIIIYLICFTVIVVSIVSGLIYMQRQQRIQKDLDYQRQKDLIEYEQKKSDKRNDDLIRAEKCSNNPSQFCNLGF